MEQEQFKQILEKYEAGTASPEEMAFLESYYKAFDLRADFKESPESDRLWLGMKTVVNSRIDDLLLHKEPGRRSKFRLWPRIAAAASIIMVLSLGSYLLFHQPQSDIQAVQNQIKPGGNVATLTLANGKRIVLNTALNGTLVSQGGIQISKTAEGQLVYRVTEKGKPQVEYNTIETPRGGQYRVELADGTVAWLNTASSLKYPNRFMGKDRVVELKGEAYFEVAKDKLHPFIVKSKGQSVEVLGTHFNISAYDDETVVRSTLLEGSISVTANGKSELLKPGQQSVLSGGALKVQEANIANAIAWKNGEFRFNDENIESIMRKVSRWYDVDIDYRGEITKEGFNGAITRFSKIEEVLQVMERSRAVHFKIQGRRIIVEK